MKVVKLLSNQQLLIIRTHTDKKKLPTPSFPLIKNLKYLRVKNPYYITVL